MLVLARWMCHALIRPANRRSQPDRRSIRRARAIVAAIVPVLLEGALPDADGASRRVPKSLPASIAAIAGLPPAVAQRAGASCSHCFPLRRHAAWLPASGHRGRRLHANRLPRFSRPGATAASPCLRSAYGALHQLILAAWYGNPRAWPAIGYGGPPSLEIRMTADGNDLRAAALSDPFRIGLASGWKVDRRLDA